MVSLWVIFFSLRFSIFSKIPARQVLRIFKVFLIHIYSSVFIQIDIHISSHIYMNSYMVIHFNSYTLKYMFKNNEHMFLLKFSKI